LFSFSSIKNYHADLLNSSTSCVEAVQFFLHQIDQQKELNAFLEVYADEALNRAAALDEKRKNGKAIGKLHGVVIGIKDVICYKGHLVSASSKILQNYTSVYNATAVQKLLEQDAIIIGRQNCDEFAMGSSSENSSFGNVLNAADQTRVPGGSSGGSAVSVQADLCMLSLGSDTGGSVRQPADFCGVIGLKPSYGRISRYGLIAYASSFDQIGIFGKYLNDVALALEVISGSDHYDSTCIQSPVPDFSNIPSNTDKKYRFCYFKQSLENKALDPEIASAVNNHFEKLVQNGHQVDAIDFELLNFTVPTYYILTTAEASANLSRFDGIRYGFNDEKNAKDLTDFYKKNRSQGFGDEVKRRILLGTFVLSEGYFDAYFTKAQQVRKLLVNKTYSLFADYDAILSPTTPTTAFKIGEKSTDPIQMFLADIYTVFANLTGIPAISLPLFKHSNGMPFGLQIMTANKNEHALLELSQKFIVQKF
jgi:aspartyl-tRNA(Asn)/glutamyl-tRNA(Gln) amidotransferase subunit A